MSSDGADFEGEEEFAAERPFGGRPFGGRPFGGRPFGGRPFGGRPFGGRPFGGRPFGGRPFGGRPFGGRPFGGRPFGGREGGQDGGGFLDPDELSADIAELFCERSAVIRLGATVAAAREGVQVPVFSAAAAFRIPGQPAPIPPVAAPAPLRSEDWRLETAVAVGQELVGGFATSPERAYTLKLELAEAFALAADTTFLQDLASPGPRGISALVPVMPLAPGTDELDKIRQLVTRVRKAPGVVFRNPGWVLAPAVLDALTHLLLADGLSVAASGPGARRILELDGADGGTLLGFPFVTTAAAGENVYFAADWQEAWIGLDPSIVTVQVGAEPPPSPGQVVISASMPLDFLLRVGGKPPTGVPPTPQVFAWAEAKARSRSSAS